MQDSYPPVGVKVRNKTFGVIVYLVFGGSVTLRRKRDNIRIVPVNQKSHVGIFDVRRKQVFRPEDAVDPARPCELWIAVQSMHEDDIYLGGGRGYRCVDLG